MHHLPYDIWYQISNFVDEDQLRELFTLNSALLTASLKARYKVAYIGLPPSNFRKFKRLDARYNDTSLAVKVHTLYIGRGPFHKTTLEEIKAVLKKVKVIYELHIDLNATEDPIFHPHKLTIVDSLWSTFATNLTNLYLRVPLNDLEGISFKELYLPALERVSFCVFKYGGSPLSPLTSFLNRHGRSMVSLHFDVRQGIDISPVLKDLDHMPSLTEFSSSQTLSGVFYFGRHFSGLAPFLQGHQSQLQRFSFQCLNSTDTRTNTMAGFFDQAWCRIPLPNLQSLSMSVPAGQRSIPYLNQFAPHLTSLKIDQYLCASTSVDELLSGFSQSRLRQLDFAVSGATPGVFRIISDHLPHLRCLILHYVYLRAIGDSARGLKDVGITRFCEAMKEVTFPEWKLERLDMLPWAQSPDTVLADIYKQTLLSSFPNVRDFGRFTRGNFLESLSNAG